MRGGYSPIIFHAGGSKSIAPNDRLQDFTPTYTSGPFEIGNGVVDDAYWSRSGPYMEGHVRIEIGSTTTVGTTTCPWKCGRSSSTTS